MLSLGCVSSGSYAATLSTSVILVLLVATVVWFTYMYDMRKIERTEYTDNDDEEATAHLRELYDQFDTNGDGIELEEVRKIVLKIDPATAPGDIEALFKKVDSDGSGQITFAEFHAAANDPGGDDASLQLDLGTLVKKKDQANVRDSAAGRLFLLVFLLCASLSTARKRACFMCSDLCRRQIQA